MPALAPTPRALCSFSLLAVLAGCHDTLPRGSTAVSPDASPVDERDASGPETSPGGSDAASADVPAPLDLGGGGGPDDTTAPPEEVPCATPGGFLCACQAQSDCLEGLCVEGPDGGVCTRPCVDACPEGFDCRMTAFGGSDPITACLPRHARLCRPCRADFDCQSPLDAVPSACVPASDPSEGLFCATSCRDLPCPEGYACQDVTSAEGASARLCVPETGLCECRPSWETLGFLTTCSGASESGTCGGTRTCGPDGLTACNARTASPEVCNALDDDCDGVTDDVESVPCRVENAFGACSGLTRCEGDASVCDGPTPSLERCNGVDDNCDGAIDERHDDCPAAACVEVEGAFVATAASTCVDGGCVYATPTPCGLFTCDAGGDGGDACATTCTGDATCVEAAHCDLAARLCVADVVDGGVCREGRECASGHCQNGFCCSGGDCCAQPTDCPAQYTVGARCDDPASCQGTRREPRCVASVCLASEPIADDGACSAEVQALDCSPLVPRFCSGAAIQTPPACPDGCRTEADCVRGFFCDASAPGQLGVCAPKRPNGAGCTAERECQSGWCENGFCCADGDCCATASDCPDTWSDPATCLDPQGCQGERVDARCLDNRCASAVVADDSRCDAATEAFDCGPFPAVYCSGAATQQSPRCTWSCTSDAGCDAGFYCNSGSCIPKLADGSVCAAANACQSNHCNNGLCCRGGSCCNRPDDCPASFSSAPVCDVPQTCQGTAKDATCSNHVCGSAVGVPNDTACTAQVVASGCDAYPDLRCNGQKTQTAPLCATGCASNADCDLNGWCQAGQCRPRLVDGSPCTDRGQCQSGHCQNGFCCASGDCCATSANCPVALYGSASTCTSATSCQGDKLTPACTNSQCGVGPRVGDDAGCAGLEANNCGYFASVFCSAASSQTAPACANNCTTSAQCDAGANCTGGVCVPNAGAGGACTSNTQCDAGLTCVDGVCCNSTCTGLCQACNRTGSLGLCGPVGSGLDPGGECGAVSCTGYYFGFEGSTCFNRAAVSAETSACNGASACQTASDVCPTAAKGSAALTCHATCQKPAAGTCSGTTPPTCSNIPGPQQNCGVGACRRTIDSCANGAPLTCTPGAPSAEVCDGLDNDCDGLTDAADADLVLANCDNQSGVCAGSKRPASLCVGGAWQSCSATQYTAHSSFFQAGSETACDGRDNDCSGQVDEDFAYTSPAGTVVTGANQACGVGACVSGVTQCSLNNTLFCSTDNKIAAETCDGVDNDCDGRVDSLDATLQLVPCGNQAGVCSGSMRSASLCALGTWQPCTATQYGAHSLLYESTEVSCDGRDNNCNGLTDDGLSAPLNSNQQGVCLNSRKTCGGLNGWQDNYAGVAGYNPSEAAPDAAYLDEDCDGIDGKVGLGLFVAPTGTDALTCGDRRNPCRTLQYAIDSRVSASVKFLYVQAGTYGSATSPALNITKSVEIFGGYNTSWLRAPRATSGHLVTLTGRDFTESGDTQSMAVRVVGAGTSLLTARLADLRITAQSPASSATESDGSGKSSYAVYGRTATLFVERCEVIQGSGAAGAPGLDGTSATQTRAASGAAGAGGTKPCGGCDTGRQTGGAGGSNTCSGTNGGKGGDGGQRDINCDFGSKPASSGLPGAAAAQFGATWGGGGSGGATCQSSPSPVSGQSGAVAHGAGGAGATGTFGQVVGNFWRGLAGASGQVGLHGGGGGGGGGAGACNGAWDECDQRGASGGGGGAGGCRAPWAGLGGAPGGGSFGVFMISGNLTVSGTAFTRGNGGAGGAGGVGGLGQPGGQGGAGGVRYPDPAITFSAAAGGDGGLGGHSGGGGGGAGGSAFGVFTLGGAVNATTGNTFTGGAGGGGGGGGVTASPVTTLTGSGGVGGALGNVRACAGASGC
jgi:hypothetical protein